MGQADEVPQPGLCGPQEEVTIPPTCGPEEGEHARIPAPIGAVPWAKLADRAGTWIE